ncbi:MAG: sigma-70 family RNA polymerase sigma factor [Planctomycetes bacterium]|nr:sigma-70 family RNA polymerase sigma factor [Planctomycetota bacterium]
MTREETSIGNSRRDFPSTHWSMILDLRDPAHPTYRRHLDELVQGYWKPVYFYMRSAWRHSIEDAKDLTQDFFSLFLQKTWVQKLDPRRGSFRAYLKTALDHFLTDCRRAQRAQKRHPAAALLHFEQAEKEFARIEPKDRDASPADMFEREWIRTVVRRTLEVLEQSLTKQGKRRHFEIFQAYSGLDDSACESAPSTGVEEVARRFGLKADHVKYCLKVVRQELRRLLRDEVRSYVDGEEEVAREMRLIMRGE